MSKITRRNFLKVTGAAAAAAALAACGAGGSANGTQFHIAVPNDTTNEAAPCGCWRRTASSPSARTPASPPPKTTSWRTPTTW